MRKRLIITLGFIIFLIISIVTFVVFIHSGFREIQIELDEEYNELFTKEKLHKSAHVAPLDKYITDTSIGFQNLDGTKSLYVYATPIHFLDKNGKWKMIDSRITNVTNDELRKKGYIYGVVANDIQSYFPKELSQDTGCLLKKNTTFEFGILTEKSIYPHYEEHKNFIGDSKNMLLYKNALQDIDVRFYPSSIGINCEIDFNKKPQKNSISFWIKVDNSQIILDKQEGGYINIVETKIQENGDMNNTILGVVQVPLLKDKEDNVSYHNNLISRPLGNNLYELVFTFESKFLDKDSTAFISFEMRRDKQPDNAIYSQRPELVEACLRNYSVIGNSHDYGIGQSLIRYQFVNKFNLKEEKIKKVNYFTYALTNTEDSYELCPILEEWCSLAGAWNNHYQTGTGISSIHLLEHEMKFDITEEVKKWSENKNERKEEFGLKMKSIAEKEGIYNIILSNDNSLYKNRTEIILE